MNPDTFVRLGKKLLNNMSLAGPLLIVLILSMMVLPLPPFILDLFFTLNIGISLVVLLVAMKSLKALDFASFPTVLLFTTLLRLSLNVASTRAVLMNGHEGPDAAGKVIESFGHFLIGGNYAVGVVVFSVLMIINFMVITKGAGRIAEVGARFTLDAMPGKQMAIDADLSAGLIKEAEAKQRRQDVSREAEFYGSMDGASKFVRGDAIAGIIIMAINMVGGLIIGVVMHDMAVGDAAATYTLLTIGDGLVAQVPSLIISTAAGIMVSRVSSDDDISKQMSDQLLKDPMLLYVVAGILTALGLIPGMPHFPFLLLAGAIGGMAYLASQRAVKQELSKEESAGAAIVQDDDKEVAWGDIAPVDSISMEIGYRLIPLLDKKAEHDLLRRIRAVRKAFSQDVGFLPDVVHVRDNVELAPNEYRILLKGVGVGGGHVHPDKHLVICSDSDQLNSLPGERTIDPSFGTPAIWVSESHVEIASFSGHAVVDPATVIATHISQIMRRHSTELLGRDEVQQLIEHTKTIAPKLIEDIVPKVLPIATLQKVLQNLLSENVSIRDAKTIIETLAEHVGNTPDSGLLTQAVRIALSRSIIQQIYGDSTIIQGFLLEPKFENMLAQAFSNGGAGIDPNMTETLMQRTVSTCDEILKEDRTPVLIVSAQIRQPLSRFLRRNVPALAVIAHDEIPDNRQLKVTHIIGS
jgi:flagellar biosynthesis protein FlhA